MALTDVAIRTAKPSEKARMLTRTEKYPDFEVSAR